MINELCQTVSIQVQQLTCIISGMCILIPAPKCKQQTDLNRYQSEFAMAMAMTKLAGCANVESNHYK